MKKITDYLFRLYQILITLFFFYLICLLLRYPAQSLEYASTGLLLWFQRMIPTLLPFMILSGIMIRLNLTERFVRGFHPLFHRLFGTTPNGSYTVFMGFLCGFPMGARIIGELLSAHKIQEKEGTYLLAFCNNIGPVYFLSFVVPVLAVPHPLLSFVIMYLLPLSYGSLLYHLYYRKHGGFLDTTKETSVSAPASRRMAPEKVTLGRLFAATDASVLAGLVGIGKLGGYMVFFNLLNMITMPFSHLPDKVSCFYNCLLEITSGISRGGSAFMLPALILLPFGGFSCIAQTYSMIQHTHLSIEQYICHKILQTLLTGVVYAFVFVCLAG